MGRMQLRQGNAAGILSAAFKVCLSVRTIFLLILLLSVAYESAIERYAGFTLTTGDGKTTVHFAVDPKSDQQQQQQQVQNQQDDESSFLARLFKFSITFPDLAQPAVTEDEEIETEADNVDRPHADVDSRGGQHVETEWGSRGTDENPLKNAEHESEEEAVDHDRRENAASGENSEPETRNNVETTDGSLLHEEETTETTDGSLLHEEETTETTDGSLLHEEETTGDQPREQLNKPGHGETPILRNSLPALKINYVENGTSYTEPVEDTNLGLFASRFRSRRGGLDRTTEPSMALGLLLLAFVALLLLLAFLFVVLCFNQSAVPAVLGHSVISAYVGKPVHLRRSLVSGFKVGLSRLMWLSVIYSVFLGAQSLLVSRVLLRNADDVETLLLRLSTMPFSIFSIFRDERIVQLGMANQVAAFLAVEYVSEAVAYAVFIVACWVTMFEREYRGMRAFRRSWELLGALPETAMFLRLCGGAFAGSSCRFVVGKVLGSYGAMLVVGAVDLYMKVVWLVFYLAARSKVQPGFGHRDLEEFLDKVR